jgi:hypothetical protein
MNVLQNYSARQMRLVERAYFGTGSGVHSVHQVNVSLTT